MGSLLSDAGVRSGLAVKGALIGGVTGAGATLGTGLFIAKVLGGQATLAALGLGGLAVGGEAMIGAAGTAMAYGAGGGALLGAVAWPTLFSEGKIAQKDAADKREIAEAERATAQASAAAARQRTQAGGVAMANQRQHDEIMNMNGNLPRKGMGNTPVVG